MKKTITLDKQQFINQLKNDFLTEVEKETFQKVKTITVNSLLNFSKSLKIIPSSTVKGMDLEMITN